MTSQVAQEHRSQKSRRRLQKQQPQLRMAEKPPEIPPEVQTRLRRLDKLEPKYVTLLSSYRIAHARVGAIETFEASLREYTPLTSINDASAFVEYLGQLNVKSDMLMEELKRV